MSTPVSRLSRVELRDPAWTAFVDSRPEAGPFHHPSWAGTIADSYSFEVFAYVLRDTGGAVIAGLPVVELGRRRRRWVSLPFTDSVGPLGDPASVDELVVALDDARRSSGLDSVEIRAAIGARDAGDVKQGVVGYRHVLTLDAGPDELFKRFNRSQVQRGIRRSEKEGVQVRIGTNEDDLLTRFYGLHLATRRRLGVPIQPRRFFETLWERIIEPGFGSVFIAEVDGAAAAAGVFVGWNRQLTYKFGASDQARWNHRPNHALHWAAIRWAHETGFARLDYGRTELENEGLRAFKSGWGTVESELVYSTLGAAAPVDRSSGLASRALGAVIRHTPESVCRQLGERLYRYAA
jgi:CelD/BcsL family acetyltransferase involved in cellulose biosynthesis